MKRVLVALAVAITALTLTAAAFAVAGSSSGWQMTLKKYSCKLGLSSMEYPLCSRDISLLIHRYVCLHISSTYSEPFVPRLQLPVSSGHKDRNLDLCDGTYRVESRPSDQRYFVSIQQDRYWGEYSERCLPRNNYSRFDQSQNQGQICPDPE